MTTELLNKLGITPGKTITGREEVLTSQQGKNLPQEWSQIIDLLRDTQIKAMIKGEQFSEADVEELVNIAEQRNLSVLRAIASNDQELRIFELTPAMIVALTAVVERFKDIQRDSS